MNTKQLERKIKVQINKVFPELDLRQINFSEGTDNSPEGTYVFLRMISFMLYGLKKAKLERMKNITQLMMFYGKC